LYGSVLSNRQDEAGWLLAHGAEINVKDDGGVTPLHLAVTQAFPDMVVTLLDNGADVNAKDNNGETPLNWACKYIKEEMTGTGRFKTRKFKIKEEDRMVLSNALYEADSPTNKLKLTNWPYTGNGPPYYDGEPTIVEMLRLRGGEK
jgi:hypothetical protein